MCYTESPMLRFIRIRNFALIRALEIEFGSGLNLLTGETGSGKSILVDALGMLVGERASQEMVRSGSEQAVLEGVFSLERSEGPLEALRQAGLEPEDDSLVIRREISASGRNRVFINNSLSTLTLLKTIGDQLVDIHGQHDHQSLLEVSRQLDLLDEYGANSAMVQEVGQRHRRMQRIARQLESGRIDEQERLKRIDILQYQLDEIRRAGLRADEREELENEKGILGNRERIFSLTSELYELAYEGEQSVLAHLNRLSRLLQELEGFDTRWSAHREAISESRYRLEDLAFSARDYTAEIDFSPDRLEQVEQRLSELDRLTRKYGHSVTETLKYADRCEVELQDLISYTDRSKQLEREFEEELKDYLVCAQELSERRRKNARQLERDIKKELRALSMDKTEFSVRLFRSEGPQEGWIPAHCGPNGIDQGEFLVSPNKGEELKPLARIASGGELSRLTLSLRCLCGGDESGKTLVFDEVDSGIGGRVAEAVGRRLRDIARRHQVLCVTHLPQIAAFATEHFSVRKEAVGPRTETLVERLADSARVEELARMLGGETITETTRRHAREMMTHSRRAEERAVPGG
jgi:DNA repair protein RecN (Recombination protein N)